MSAAGTDRAWSDTGNRVVVSGIGSISPLGLSKNENWEAALQGRTAIEKIPSAWSVYNNLKSTVWAPLPAGTQERIASANNSFGTNEPCQAMALWAALDAIRDAGFSVEQVPGKKKMLVDTGDFADCGVVMGSSIPGTTATISMAYDLQKDRAEIDRSDYSGRRKPESVHPQTLGKIMSSGVAAVIGQAFMLSGLNYMVSTACSSGIDAIGQAFQLIRSGQKSRMLCGASEYNRDEFGGIFKAFDNLSALAIEKDAIADSNKPFDRDRSGFLFAEGGATILVLESLSSALERGAHIYAEIVDYRPFFESYHMFALDPDTTEKKRNIEALLSGAGLTPRDIGCLSLHGTGTVQNDEIEAEIAQSLFGAGMAAMAPKALTGHMFGASSAFEISLSCLALSRQCVLPTPGIVKPMSTMNFASSAEPRHMEYCLKQSFAFGGNNALVLLKAWDDSQTLEGAERSSTPQGVK